MEYTDLRESEFDVLLPIMKTKPPRKPLPTRSNAPNIPVSGTPGGFESMLVDWVVLGEVGNMHL